VYSTTWYTCNCAGNVERVVTQGNQSSQYSATRFSFAKNQRTVSFALAETWDPDGQVNGARPSAPLRERYERRDQSPLRIRQVRGISCPF